MTAMTSALWLMLSLSAPLLGTRWELTELKGAAVEGARPYLSLEAETNRATGSGGCNRFSGPFELEEDSLRFGPLAATRMACAEGMDVEVKLFEALEAVEKYRIEGETLELLDAAGETLLRFGARTSP
ncbi:MAG: META domain-containing protein [Vicinamibacteria bacterium]